MGNNDNENEEQLSDCNVGVELNFVGAIAKNLDNLVNYSNFVRSKYDFSDPHTKFLYDALEVYYLTYSQTLDENKLNMFMSQDNERLRMYKKIGSWRYVDRCMKRTDEHDIENYFKILKKYSLIREYGRNGYPIQNILRQKNFDKLDANDIYRIIRTRADKINTVINAGSEAVDLTSGNSIQVDEYLKKPNYGLPYPWHMFNEYFLGMREKKVLFSGFLSNAGKTRQLVMLAAYTALVQGENFLILSNEMDEDDLRSCLITTVINNSEFQDLHGVHLQKPEREIVLGVYHDNKGNILRRKIDENGIYTETDEQFTERVQEESEEYWQVKKVMNWIDSDEREAKVLFKDIGDNYSPSIVEFELRKAKMVQGIKYYGYDTLKGYGSDDWSQIKQFATRIKELTKELKMNGFVNFQLTDDTVFTDVFNLSSNNIANAKQIKHIADSLCLGKQLNKTDYHNYRLVRDNEMWGEPVEEELDLKKQYFAIKVDKNRAGAKDKIMLFEINLDLNIWSNIGYLVRKK